MARSNGSQGNKGNSTEATEKMSVKHCSECGFCKNSCPVFRVALNEYKSPRGKAIMLKQGVPDSVIFDCTLCLACQEACPMSIDFQFIEARKRLVTIGQSPEANREMLENIRKHGNPFGRLEKGKKPEKLYCC